MPLSHWQGFLGVCPKTRWVFSVADMFSKEKRSEVMRSIKGKGTKPELDTAKMLRRAKIKYRSHPKMYGSPDFIVESRLLLFCDGSFWHGRDWKKLKARLAAGNDPNYWVRHIDSNRKRDRKVNRTLREQGHPVLRLWDIDVRKRPERCVGKIRNALRTNDAPPTDSGKIRDRIAHTRGSERGSIHRCK